MPRTAHPAPARRHGLAVVVLLALALWWAQWVGLVHGARHHGPDPGGAHVSASHHGTAHAGVLGHLFAPAGDDGDCRLYDQLGQGSALTPLPLALPVLVPLLPFWGGVRPRAARPCPAFAARAPPTSR